MNKKGITMYSICIFFRFPKLSMQKKSITYG